MLTILELISNWAIPFILIVVPVVGFFRQVPVYESFVEGAKEGFQIAIRILPFLTAMFVAIQVFRDSGALDLVVSFLQPVTDILNIPKEVLPLALVRPLSGSGALAMLANILETYGPDSLIGQLASTIQGSTETTLYVTTVYFGAVGIRRIRHSLVAGLAGDLSGFLAAAYIVNRLFG